MNMRSTALLVGVLLVLAITAGACKSDNNSGVPTPDLYDDTPTAVSSGGETPSVDATPTQGALVGTFAERCQKSDQKQFTQPEQVIDTSRTYIATIKTDKGDIVVELDSRRGITTNNFVFLACKGFYDGLIFHRVVKEPDPFVIQGGDPTGTGSGGPGYSIPGEFEGSNFVKGVIGMARSDAPDSAGSQFYIMIGDNHNLDGSYADFGHVTSGQDVADQIAQGDAINTVEIVEQ